MATWKAILGDYESLDGYEIYIRIHHNGRKKRYSTGCKTKKQHWIEWDEKSGKQLYFVTNEHPDSVFVNKTIRDGLDKVADYEQLCKLLKKPFNLNHALKDDVQEINGNFSKYLQELIGRYKSNKMFYSADACVTILSQINQYNENADVYFADINKDFITGFLKFLQIEKVSTTGVPVKPNGINTKRTKIRRLGGYYNIAINDGLVPKPNPFEQYLKNDLKEKAEKKRIEWLEDNEVKMLEDVKVSGVRKNRIKDMYLLAVYVRGLRFENVVLLKKSDIRHERIYYTPNKGGEPTSAPITPKVQAILDKYLSKKGEYLFAPSKQKPLKTKEDIHLFLKKTNKGYNDALRMVIQEAGINKHITFHTARHTFAYKAVKAHRNNAIVSKLIQHKSESTTRIYTAKFDHVYLDAAYLEISQ